MIRLHQLVACFAFSAALSAQSLPTVTLDLGTKTARIQSRAAAGNTQGVLLISASLLPQPMAIPGAQGLLEVDPTTAIPVAVQFDAHGRHDIWFTHSNPTVGLELHAQVVTVGAATLQLSAASTDHIPGSDALFLDHTVESGLRMRSTVPEVVALPNGGYRLFHNDPPQGIGSSTSEDGITFVRDPGIRVPNPGPGLIPGNAAPLVLPDGRLRLYYIVVQNQGTPAQTEQIWSSISASASNWINFTAEPGARYLGAENDNQRLGVPDLIDIGGGRIRMYHQGDLPRANNVRTAISVDGGWTFKQEVVGVLPTGASGRPYVDADVVRLRDGRLRCLSMLFPRASSSAPRTFYAFTSIDGLTWTIENGGNPILSEMGLADPAQVLLPDGSIRTYYHDMRVGSPRVIRSSVTTDETGRGQACPGGPLCADTVEAATSLDGLAWSQGGPLISAASAPAPVWMPDGRLLVYFMDGTTTPAHLAVFELVDGGRIRDVRRVTILGTLPEGVVNVTDPAPAVVGESAYLYVTLAGPAPSISGVGRGSLDASGTILTLGATALPLSTGATSPDVVRDGAGLWHLFAYTNTTARFTSTSGAAFSAAAVSGLSQLGHSRPLQASNGWWMYTCDQGTPPPNAVRLHTSADLSTWTPTPTPLFFPPPGATISDTQVVLDGVGGYVMVFKIR